MKFEASPVQDKNAFEEEINNILSHYRGLYLEEVKGYYTNWNAGLTKNKRKTFDYTFDRKSTVARANVEKMINDALSTGKFREIDQLYVKLINATCRHINHSGPNGFPSKKDRCSVKKSVVDSDARERELKKWEKQPKRGRDSFIFLAVLLG